MLLDYLFLYILISALLLSFKKIYIVIQCISLITESVAFVILQMPTETCTCSFISKPFESFNSFP